MREREKEIARQSGIFDKCTLLEGELLQLQNLTNVDFDLNGFYDGMHQVIIIFGYDIRADREDYFEARRKMLKEVLDIADRFGLSRTEDRIEDMGAHYYIVFRHDKTWATKKEESNAKNI